MTGRESYLYHSVKYRPYQRIKRECLKEVPWVPKRCLGSQRGAYARWCPKEVPMQVGALLNIVTAYLLQPEIAYFDFKQLEPFQLDIPTRFL